MNPVLLAVALVLLASGGAGAQGPSGWRSQSWGKLWARAPAEGGKSISHSAAKAHSVTISRPLVTRTFDGRLTSVARLGATHTLTWDAGHRLTGIAGGGLTQTRAHDGPGKRLSSISFFDGTPEEGDPLGALTYTWNLDQPRLGLATHPWLAISDTLDGAARRTEHWLDDAERLSRVIQPGANGRRQHDYTWRADGARTAETITDPDDTDDEACGENDPCAVPGEACVDGFCRSLETRIVHEFDGLGQLTSIERFTRRRQAGNQGWQAEPGSLVDVQSDGWGRITSYQTHGFARQMAWDVEGRMLSLDDGIDTYQYRYNHRDQRLTRAGPGGHTVHSAWEADGLLAERFDGANPDAVRTHLRGAGMVLGVDDVAFGLDHLGSPVLRWNGAAAITRFDAWGAQVGGNAPQFGHESVGYTGHTSDAESGLTYAQARYYDPGIGHFLSPDPWSGALEVPGTLQKYTYGLGNPLRYTDPDGRRVELRYDPVWRKKREEAGRRAKAEKATRRAAADTWSQVVEQVCEGSQKYDGLCKAHGEFSIQRVVMEGPVDQIPSADRFRQYMTSQRALVENGLEHMPDGQAVSLIRRLSGSTDAALSVGRGANIAANIGAGLLSGGVGGLWGGLAIEAATLGSDTSLKLSAIDASDPNAEAKRQAIYRQATINAVALGVGGVVGVGLGAIARGRGALVGDDSLIRGALSFADDGKRGAASLVDEVPGVASTHHWTDHLEEAQRRVIAARESVHPAVRDAGMKASKGGVRYRIGREVPPIEKTLDMALDPNIYIGAVVKKYGINLRGSGHKIEVVFNPKLVSAGKSRQATPNIIEIGPSALSSEAELANTIAHELNHARSWLRGGGAPESTAYPAGDALEEYIRGLR